MRKKKTGGFVIGPVGLESKKIFHSKWQQSGYWQWEINIPVWEEVEKNRWKGYPWPNTQFPHFLRIEWLMNAPYKKVSVDRRWATWIRRRWGN